MSVTIKNKKHYHPVPGKMRINDNYPYWSKDVSDINADHLNPRSF